MLSNLFGLIGRGLSALRRGGRCPDPVVADSRNWRFIAKENDLRTTLLLLGETRAACDVSSFTLREIDEAWFWARHEYYRRSPAYADGTPPEPTPACITRYHRKAAH
jgi:hypothetical protein